MSEQFGLPNTHPGEILLEEFMKPLGLTAYRLSKHLDVPTSRIDFIIARKRGITADTATRLGAYFANSPQFWLNLQSRYELMEVKRAGKINVQPRPELAGI